MLFKPKLLITSVIAVLFITFLFARPYIFGKSFEDLAGTSSKNITEVFMRSGMNGDSVATTDKAKINEIVDLVDNRHYTKSKDQEPKTGYNYFYDFYVGDKKVLTITNAGSRIKANTTYCNVDKPIPLDGIKKWFNSLPVSKLPDEAGTHHDTTNTSP
ncbi:MAG: hypothetical protein QME45_03465 [Clostridiales bacterium]|nr:hypothetical protein [Clostridiales bacterium]